MAAAAETGARLDAPINVVASNTQYAIRTRVLAEQLKCAQGDAEVSAHSLETSGACVVPQPLSAETAVARAIKRNPARMTKVARGQRPARFQAFTISELLQKHRDPRDVLLEIAGTDTEALALKLKCSLQDALAERRLCAQSVLPYVCQKLPVQVDMRQSRAIHLNIVDDRQYQELVAVAQQTDDPSDDSLSLQLIAASPVADTSVPEGE